MSEKSTYKVRLDIDDEHALRKARGYADVYYDGHFTMFKFTTNYRFCFGTLRPPDYDPGLFCTEKMAEGRTLGEAIAKAINDDLDDRDVIAMVEEELSEGAKKDSHGRKNLHSAALRKLAGI